MSKAVGIDLGTTFSVVAYLENGKAIVIPNKEGEPLMPSVVAFDEGGSRFVGKLARAQAVANPLRTIASIKRWMGSDRRIKIDGKIYSPQEISGFILHKVKKQAETCLRRRGKKGSHNSPCIF